MVRDIQESLQDKKLILKKMAAAVLRKLTFYCVTYLKVRGKGKSKITKAKIKKRVFNNHFKLQLLCSK